jgi:hypothetical protein
VLKRESLRCVLCLEPPPFLQRYLKTTVGGLTGCLPDFVMLMVGANAGLVSIIVISATAPCGSRLTMSIAIVDWYV